MMRFFRKKKELQNSTSPSLDATAVITETRQITHAQFARDIAAARSFVRANIPAEYRRVVLKESLHRYLSCVLRVALLAEGKWQIQNTRRTPPQANAVWITPYDAAVSDKSAVGINLADLQAYVNQIDPTPVWDLIPALNEQADPVLTLYTSGTTGNPKGVVLSGAQIVLRLANGAEAYGINAHDCLYCQMGSDTIGGVIMPLRTWCAGGSVIVGPPLDSTNQALRSLYHQCTVIMASPAGLQETLDVGEVWPDKNRRRAYLGGSQVRLPLARRIANVVCESVNVVYGSTECGATAIVDAQRLEEDDALVGKILPGYELVINDDSGNALPVGEEGVVAMRCAWAVAGYEDGLPSDAFHNGWFLPGDIGRINELGELFINGRHSDVLNFSGFKFLASSFENRLLTIPELADVFVTVVYKDGIERLVIMTVSTMAPEALLHTIQDHLDRPATFTLIPVQSIPRNHMGKINREFLRSEIEQTLTVRQS